MLSAKMAPEPRHKTLLPQAVRYFERNGYQLSRTGKYLGKGATVMLGRILKLQYDHRTQDATGFVLNGQEYYLLLDEIQLAGLHEKLEALEKHPRHMLITT